jgi:hypothetical protein
MIPCFLFIYAHMKERGDECMKVPAGNSEGRQLPERPKI